MAGVDVVRSALGLTSSNWQDYIKDGVITKKPAGTYEIGEVAGEIIRWQKSRIRSVVADKTNTVRRVEKEQRKNAKLEAKLEMLGGSGDSKGKGEPLPINNKERIDLEISKQKLRKMKHDAKVREKEVMPIDNVFEFVTSIASEFAASLDPLMGSIKQSVPSMSSRAHDELKKSFAVIRNNLSRHIEGKTTNEMIALFDPDNGDLEEWE